MPNQVPALFPDHLDQHPFGAVAIKFAVEDLLPRAEIKFTPGNGHDNFPTHDLPFHVGIGIIFAGAVVMVALGRFIKGSELFEPLRCNHSKAQ